MKKLTDEEIDEACLIEYPPNKENDYQADLQEAFEKGAQFARKKADEYAEESLIEFLDWQSEGQVTREVAIEVIARFKESLKK